MAIHINRINRVQGLYVKAVMGPLTHPPCFSNGNAGSTGTSVHLQNQQGLAESHQKWGAWCHLRLLAPQPGLLLYNKLNPCLGSVWILLYIGCSLSLGRENGYVLFLVIHWSIQNGK